MILTGPDDQPLPFGYRWAIVNGLKSFTPWYVLDSPKQVAGISREFSVETGIECWAFARRQDMDDAAAFVVRDSTVVDEVISAHLSWKGSADPHVRVERFPDFWAWLKGRALPDMADWPSELDIQEALGGRAV